ncbi:MAG: arsenite efflux transporter metallochaperone ArsD [Balneolaceae bacterium]|nr:arsenite efflux transporter metallochaperone ArsD [Balneolaceae bacterium]
MKDTQQETMTLEVFDPAMCCSTGVCGPDVDDALVDFSNDVKWLKSQGIEVRRYNLGQEPEAFKSNAQVISRLQAEGSDILPILAVNGSIVSEGGYPGRQQLIEWMNVNSEINFESENNSLDASQLMQALETAVADGNESEMKTLFQKGKKQELPMPQLISAMQKGIDRRQQKTQKIVRKANELLGISSNGCAPGSGCC